MVNLRKWRSPCMFNSDNDSGREEDTGSSGALSSCYFTSLPERHTEQDAKRKRDITASEAMENHLKLPKREKNIIQKATGIDFNGACSANSDDQLSGKTSKASDFSPPVVSDQPSSNITICGFCQSARVSEASGEMLHYSRGRPVVGDDIFRSNVIHVHSACI